MAARPRSEPFAERACPLGACDGSGWILGPEDVARPCECRAQRLKRGRVRGVASAIPPRYRGVSFDRPPVTQLPETAVQAVRNYVRELDANLSAGRGIWFMGDIGTGKTTLAMLISKSAIDAGRSVAIYSMPKLLTRIRRTYEGEPGGDTYSQFFDRLTSVDLLHIDDLGAERHTEWVLEQLYSIVNERYESRRAIMFTTNVAAGGIESRLKEIEEQIGARTLSRLIEMSGDPIAMFGQDNRYTAVPSDI
jgi:DNA replication protein DnaC